METKLLVESPQYIHRETVCLNQCYMRKNTSPEKSESCSRLWILSCQKHKVMGPRNISREHNKICGTAGIPVPIKKLQKFTQFISL